MSTICVLEQHTHIIRMNTMCMCTYKYIKMGNFIFSFILSSQSRCIDKERSYDKYTEKKLTLHIFVQNYIFKYSYFAFLSHSIIFTR